MVVKVGQAHIKILLGMSRTVFTDSWVIFFLAWSFICTCHSLLWSGQGLTVVSVNVGMK